MATPRSGSRCARTASAIPARCCSTPPSRPVGPDRAGAARSWPGSRASADASSATACACRSARSSSTSTAPSSTSTPSSAPTAPKGQTMTRRRGQTPACSALPSSPQHRFLPSPCPTQPGTAARSRWPGAASWTCGSCATTSPENSATTRSPPISASSPAREPMTSAASRPIRAAADLDAWHVTPHARRMITTCWQLGQSEKYATLRLAKWAHQLRYRGHFSTHSRRYSVTLRSRR
jgi:hypothetical protein